MENAPEHLRGLTPEEISAHIAEVQHTAEAGSLPLPGPLGAAFAGLGRKVGGILVRCPVALDFAILQKLDSPLLQQMAEANKPRELRQPTEFTDQDGYDMVYQFTRPIMIVEEAIAAGVKEFQIASRHEIGRAMNPFVVNAIVAVIGDQLIESYTTALRYIGGDGDPGKDFPAPPAGPKTGSAGGSTTSAS